MMQKEERTALPRGNLKSLMKINVARFLTIAGATHEIDR